jgi:glycosyltransferase involved in cell wall biosynthesis
MTTDNSSKRMPHMIWVCPDSIESINLIPLIAVTRELRKLDWRVTLIFSGPADTRSILGVEVLCIPMPPIYLLRQVIFHLKAILYVIRNWSSVDVVYYNQMSVPFFLPIKWWRKIFHKNRPLAILDTRTVPMELESKASLRDRLRGWSMNVMNKITNLWGDDQTAITQRMADAIHIPADKLLGIWPSGVDLEQFSPAIGLRKWPASYEPVHLIYIGILHYERNLMTLCQAAKKAIENGMNFKVTFVGEGTERADLEEFAKNTNGWVSVLPPVPHSEIPNILAQAHVGILIFPDEPQFRVSSPIKLFEYMAAGLPILATRIVCHTDVVGAGNFAFWAEDSDIDAVLEALKKIWRSRDSLPIMGREAAIAAHSWSWEKSARKLKACLETGLQKEDAENVISAPVSE